MIEFIRQALRCYETTGVCIVNNPTDNNLAIETMDGQVFIQVNKSMNLSDVLEMCSINVDSAASEMAEHIAKKMCNLINDCMSGIQTRLDINHVNNQAIEEILNEQRNVMLDYIAGEFMYPETIKKG